MMRKIFTLASLLRCKICNGFGGEWGDAHGVGPMCRNCYIKGGYGQ